MSGITLNSVIVVVILAAIGASVGVFMAKRQAKKGENTDGEGTYMTEGICYGMLVGIVLAEAFDKNMPTYLAIGMSCGLVIGMSIKKK